MKGYERVNLVRELDEALLAFRLVRRRRASATAWGRAGWLKSIRQGLGIPVDEVARRMGVCRWEVHRLEESEKNSRIMLATLSRAAEGLGCELVYALTPKEGTLEAMAARERTVREGTLRKKREERAAEKGPWLERIGWRAALLGSLRTALRREGVRVRPRTTNRGVAKQKAEFKETAKLAGLAGRMGAIAGQRVSKSASQRTRE
jgi:transcriptional regulator with XRE-family HTH domain